MIDRINIALVAAILAVALALSADQPVAVNLNVTGTGLTVTTAPVAEMPQRGPGVGSDFVPSEGNRRVGARARDDQNELFIQISE